MKTIRGPWLKMKMIIAKALGLSFTIVGVLTFFEYTASTTLIYLLYPGAMLSLLMTGGHGGTLLETGRGWRQEFS